MLNNLVHFFNFCFVKQKSVPQLRQIITCIPGGYQFRFCAFYSPTWFKNLVKLWLIHCNGYFLYIREYTSTSPTRTHTHTHTRALSYPKRSWQWIVCRRQTPGPHSSGLTKSWSAVGRRKMDNPKYNGYISSSEFIQWAISVTNFELTFKKIHKNFASRNFQSLFKNFTYQWNSSCKIGCIYRPHRNTSCVLALKDICPANSSLRFCRDAGQVCLSFGCRISVQFIVCFSPSNGQTPCPSQCPVLFSSR